MASQMRADIGAFDLILFAGLIADDDDLDAFRPSQKGHSIADRSAAARPPSQQTMTCSSLSGSFWMYGTTISGPPGLNSAASTMFSSSAVGFRLRLPDNG